MGRPEAEVVDCKLFSNNDTLLLLGDDDDYRSVKRSHEPAAESGYLASKLRPPRPQKPMWNSQLKENEAPGMRANV